MSRKKLPFIQFFPADHVQDTQTLSLEAKGAWISFLCAMWIAPEPGKLQWGIPQTKIFLGIEDDGEFFKLMDSLRQVGDLTLYNGAGEVVTDWGSASYTVLINRRIRRDYERLSLRKARNKRYYDAVKTRVRRVEARIHISESKIKEEDTMSDPSGSDLSVSMNLKDLVESWNEYFSGKLPQVTWPLSSSREKKARLRLREHPLVAYWQKVFDNIEDTDFLLGKNGRQWYVTFDWLIENDTNSMKVWEGQYDKGKKAGHPGGHSG